MNNYYGLKVQYSRYGYTRIYDRYEYSEYSSRLKRNLQKRKEMEANIPKRAIMLEKLFDNDLSYLPHLPYELLFTVAQYEGGVESFLLGNNDNNVQDHSICSWCNIL